MLCSNIVAIQEDVNGGPSGDLTANEQVAQSGREEQDIVVASPHHRIFIDIYLVRVAKRADGSLYLERKPHATTADDYIAISHVWGTPETIRPTAVEGMEGAPPGVAPTVLST